MKETMTAKEKLLFLHTTYQTTDPITDPHFFSYTAPTLLGEIKELMESVTLQIKSRQADDAVLDEHIRLIAAQISSIESFAEKTAPGDFEKYEEALLTKTNTLTACRQFYDICLRSYGWVF